MKTIYLLFSLTLVNLFCLAQAPGNSLGGYANVDNNINKIPRAFFGISPLAADFGPGVSLRPSGHLRLRGDKFGEFQLNGTFTPNLIVVVPKEPFGSRLRCNTCADNNFTAYSDIEASYGYNIINRTDNKLYAIKLKSATYSFSDSTKFTAAEKEILPGQIQRLWGVRVGAAYQNGSVYLLNQKRTIAYHGYEQTLVSVGVTRTSIGRMYKNFDDYGVKGRNIHNQYYADLFYALDQRFISQQVDLIDNSGRPIVASTKAVPYGMRVGFLTYFFGYQSKFALYSKIEMGIRPTFEEPFNGAYASIKIGAGIGWGKTPIAFVSKHQSKLNNVAPSIEGNGKYKRRGPIGLLLHPRNPYRMIKHRYGK